MAFSLFAVAVAYECLRTITSIYPDKGLIDKAAKCVRVFLVAKTNDIRYMGKSTLFQSSIFSKDRKDRALTGTGGHFGFLCSEGPGYTW